MPAPVVAALTQDDQPIRKTVRRLRWFKHSFASQVEQIAAQTGIVFRIDERRLAATFIDWLRMFQMQKPSDPGSRRDYVGFAAGLMLRAMITHKPLTALSVPEGANINEPVFFWPEGYLYVVYCLSVRSAVLSQDFDETQKVTPELTEIQTWWSFKENVSEDVFLSTAFLDLFAGDIPDWDRSSFFAAREHN